MAQRLERHLAGKRLEYGQTSPEILADNVFGLLGRDATWPTVRMDGARRAAELISGLAVSASPAQRA